MDNLKDIMDLFNRDMFRRMRHYAPAEDLPDKEKVISGRFLEEVVELHLASGGTPTSALMHVTDAITNEAFKIKKIAKSNQEAYPSNFESTYNEKETVIELADCLFLFLVNMMVNRADFRELKEEIDIKLDKLEKARVEGRLHITDKGLFYIQKD